MFHCQDNEQTDGSRPVSLLSILSREDQRADNNFVQIKKLFHCGMSLELMSLLYSIFVHDFLLFFFDVQYEKLSATLPHDSKESEIGAFSQKLL